MLKDNLERVLTSIEKANTDKRDIKLVCVSKSVGSAEVEQMSQAGQVDFGENRVQVLKQKKDELAHLELDWHFIGRLQNNKINQLIELKPVLWHSCDSLERALEFDKRLGAKNKTQATLLQINSANEDAKQGVSLENACDIYEQIRAQCPNIKLKGVMSIGAYSEDKKRIQKSFEQTYKIYESLKGAKICSMGMSNDYELAVKCGSNMLRVGSALFR